MQTLPRQQPAQTPLSSRPTLAVPNKSPWLSLSRQCARYRPLGLSSNPRTRLTPPPGAKGTKPRGQKYPRPR
eukprot:10847578-Lingulodinium_polyedra.AAC.1